MQVTFFCIRVLWCSRLLLLLLLLSFPSQPRPNFLSFSLLIICFFFIIVVCVLLFGFTFRCVCVCVLFFLSSSASFSWHSLSFSSLPCMFWPCAGVLKHYVVNCGTISRRREKRDNEMMGHDEMERYDVRSMNCNLCCGLSCWSRCRFRRSMWRRMLVSAGGE